MHKRTRSKTRPGYLGTSRLNRAVSEWHDQKGRVYRSYGDTHLRQNGNERTRFEFDGFLPVPKSLLGLNGLLYPSNCSGPQGKCLPHYVLSLLNLPELVSKRLPLKRYSGQGRQRVTWTEPSNHIGWTAWKKGEHVAIRAPDKYSEEKLREIFKKITQSLTAAVSGPSQLGMWAQGMKIGEVGAYMKSDGSEMNLEIKLWPKDAVSVYDGKRGKRYPKTSICINLHFHTSLKSNDYPVRRKAWGKVNTERDFHGFIYEQVVEYFRSFLEQPSLFDRLLKAVTGQPFFYEKNVDFRGNSFHKGWYGKKERWVRYGNNNKVKQMQQQETVDAPHMMPTASAELKQQGLAAEDLQPPLSMPIEPAKKRDPEQRHHGDNLRSNAPSSPKAG